MFTLYFWKQAAERAVKTAAQAVLVLWGVTEMTANFAEISIDISAALTAAGIGFVSSILTSLVSAPLGTHDEDPSLV